MSDSPGAFAISDLTSHSCARHRRARERPHAGLLSALLRVVSVCAVPPFVSVTVPSVASVGRATGLTDLQYRSTLMALQLDEQLRRHDDLARRANDLRSYL